MIKNRRITTEARKHGGALDYDMHPAIVGSYERFRHECHEWARMEINADLFQMSCAILFSLVIIRVIRGKIFTEWTLCHPTR